MRTGLPMTLASDINLQLGTPTIGLTAVVISSGARTKLPSVLDALPNSRHVAVLMDDRPYRTSNGDLFKSALLDMIANGRVVHTTVLTGDVHADETTVKTARAGCAQADAVVTIGSGTLCDIGKVAAGDKPHIVVQTAASVNGFADDQSVLLINGVKRTMHSTWPHTLIVDEEILAGAPPALNRSGFGDMISMFTAPADWYLSSLFAMDRGFSAGLATMTRRYGNDLLRIASGVGLSVPADLATLAEFVTLSGLSMGAAGQTSPSSGMEHTISHMLDMAHGAQNRPTAQHGEQVGVATVLVSLLWRRTLERIASGTLPPLTLPSPDEARSAVYSAFSWMDQAGVVAGECWSDYAKKLQHLDSTDAPARLHQAIQDWSSHTQALNMLLEQPEQILRALKDAGAPVRFSELSHPATADTVTWALANCHLMRNRFTIADLAFLTGTWTFEDVVAVLDEAAQLSGGA
ncbi:iron-containing alcohol dehydrogenase [Streptomyces sp900105245]|uniref:Iron-containing alcohol dehydrogenase n=1 Tax=Streptomyces sp. 900105245 TaxID=3154379 RepID=A0ABV1UK54_9ACTN